MHRYYQKNLKKWHKTLNSYMNDSGNLKITNLDRLIFTKNGEFTI